MLILHSSVLIYSLIMKIKIILLAFFFTPLFAFGWGSEGHKMVAKIAQEQLSDSAEARVKRYLGSFTFESAAVWMDEIRSDHSYDYMKPWHYVNIEKDATYVKNPKGDVVSELDRVISELKSYKTMKAEDIAFDLRVLFHLCGDMVQPLHTGYGSDLGGNNIKVMFNGKETNLHHIWDTDIIVSGGVTMEGCMKAAKKWKPEKLKEIQKIDAMTWMNDSRSLLPQAYKYEGNEITKKYIKKNKRIVEQQIAKGGYRLAAVLEEIFK